MRTLAALALIMMTNVAMADDLLHLEPGASLGEAIGLSATGNLRDLGGYETSEDRTVVRGLLYRSNVFNPMSQDDIAKLRLLALKTDYDLRTVQEIKIQPDQMPIRVQQVHLNVLADGQSAASAQLEALLHDPKKANAVLGGGRLEVHIKEGYREFVSLPSAQRAYQELFLSLADKSNLPAVFHCTTGKDRTGWAAAALLTLLGVPRETVMADYMRSNEYLLPDYRKTIQAFAAGGGERGIALAIFGVKREYLEAAFDEMQRSYGTIENYFSDGLGIDEDQQQVLREIYLQDSPRAK
ncbi:protein-tyrosine-phosphatase [Nitrospira sp. KM1]|uniref:tyrosine-protein phosphatase n=1 Tax=Nitrospira sp. KM1 TaxID=1936990 RepID=UPI0013A755B6|nr:tyrosine-protein phosphatase [Nitrospira sp. KM1]BCA53237.1 protein-tyrosine-phosphatase [Nitrospira sp. KM1]